MRGIGFYGSDFFTIKEGNSLLSENITRILLTMRNERVMSNLRSKLKQYLFEPTNILQEDVENEIQSVISRWEPRAQISNLSAEMLTINKAEISFNVTNKETLEQFQYDTVMRF